MCLIKRNLLLLLFCLSGCSSDLLPSDKDIRTSQVDEQKVSFRLQTTQGELLESQTLLESADALVLYFTMWCPVCDSHMSQLSRQFIPVYGNMRFVVVDYVSGSVSQSLEAQRASGFLGMTIGVDLDNEVTRTFRGTMATVVVINKEGRLLLNEDYKDGARLKQVLDGLL